MQRRFRPALSEYVLDERVQFRDLYRICYRITAALVTHEGATAH